MLADINIGLLFIFAMSSLASYGVVLAGWSSNSKYSMLGGFRAAAQQISYEIPLILAVLGMAVATGARSVLVPRFSPTATLELVGELGVKKTPPAPLAMPAPMPAPGGPPATPTAATCMTCHQLPPLVVQKRPGYWHFEKVHTVVLAKQFDCMKCHADLGPAYEPSRHHIDRLAQSRVCTNCHAGEDR